MQRVIRSVVVVLLGGLAAVNGQLEVPVVKTLGEKRQARTSYLNPEFLVFPAEEGKRSKLPLLIYLHGAGGVGDDLGKIRGQARRVVSGIRKFGKGPGGGSAVPQEYSCGQGNMDTGRS